jgi:hypothetical protein
MIMYEDRCNRLLVAIINLFCAFALFVIENFDAALAIVADTSL